MLHSRAAVAAGAATVAAVADVFDNVAANWFGLRAANGSARIASMFLRLYL